MDYHSLPWDINHFRWLLILVIKPPRHEAAAHGSRQRLGAVAAEQLRAAKEEATHGRHGVLERPPEGRQAANLQKNM